VTPGDWERTQSHIGRGVNSIFAKIASDTLGTNLKPAPDVSVVPFTHPEFNQACWTGNGRVTAVWPEKGSARLSI